MNNNDFLTQLNEYLSQINEIADKANKLAEEYTASEQAKAVDNAKEVDDKSYILDLLKDYVDAFNNEMFWVECDSISHGYIDDDDSNVFSFENFTTEEYAKKLQKLNKFNGMMLAFKYCYDRDYEPNWADDSPKYTVVWNMATNRFDYVWATLTRCNYVYFSSDDIAKKCAEWLNKVAESEDLI
jgi:hypothetical protein